jgi:hypothetical protein
MVRSGTKTAFDLEIPAVRVVSRFKVKHGYAPARNCAVKALRAKQEGHQSGEQIVQHPRH